MSDFDFATLQQYLPPESLRWEGFGTPVTLNLSAIAGDAELTPESLVLEVYGRLLDALAAIQASLNESRETPINVVQKSVAAQGGNPVFQWAFRLEIDGSSALNNVVNPLEQA